MGESIGLPQDGGTQLLIRPEIAERQRAADLAAATRATPSALPDGQQPRTSTQMGTKITAGAGKTVTHTSNPPPSAAPRRFHGSVTLDPARVGRDASRIADEVIAHLVALVGANVTVTLEIEAIIPAGAPDHVVRTVTENSRTLKFTSQGFESE